MSANKVEKSNETIKRISKDRKRTNILRKPEQALIAWLVQRVPKWITSDGLTIAGLFGNMIVAASFLLASMFHINWLLLSILGFVVNWVGDSLDGRLAYYRNKPRKWYGFTFDITIDWVGIIFIGAGFMFYVGSPFYFLGFLFVALYGWEMITALIRYKITGSYSIDSGILGPTEVRIIIAAILIMEVLIPGSIIYTVSLICIVLMIANITDSKSLISMADAKDRDKKTEKEIREILKQINEASESLMKSIKKEQ